MKIIVTHTSPDWDAITSIWLIKRYFPGWEDATAQFVPAGERSEKCPLRPPKLGEAGSEASKTKNAKYQDVVETAGDDQYIHVDTGLGPLDHHQTGEQTVSAASLAWDFVKIQNFDLKEPKSQHMEDRIQAISRIVAVVVETDHFKEVFWDNPAADYYELSLLGLLEGVKFQKPGDDSYYVKFGMDCLDAILHTFENRIWAEKEIEKGTAFETKWGKGLGFETINDTVLKLAQKMGYAIVVRKDPRKGYVRIKGRPQENKQTYSSSTAKRSREDSTGDSSGPFGLAQGGQARTIIKKEVDLTLAHEKLKKMDPEATWFLHASKKMLLNGTPKNPKMIPSKLSLSDIIEVLKSI